MQPTSRNDSPERGFLSHSRNAFGLIVLTFCILLSAQAAEVKTNTAIQGAATADITSQVERCLKDLESITKGMTRAQVKSLLRLDGGLQSGSPVRFVHPNCPYFKINVEFDFKRDAADQNRAIENANDPVTRVSKPYLERPYSD